MSHNGHRVKEDEQRAKLERLRKERAQSRSRLLTGGAIAAVLLVAGIAIFYAINSSPGAEYAPAQDLGAGNAGAAVMTLPVSSAGSAARFYTYDSGGTQVRFFIAKGTDGKVHVATDACDVCYGSHKGYRQTGNDMTCNNCGKVFAINNLGVKNTSGGCWPSYIPMNTDGSNIVIQKSDLDGKAFMFR